MLSIFIEICFVIARETDKTYNKTNEKEISIFHILIKIIYFIGRKLLSNYYTLYNESGIPFYFTSYAYKK